MSLETTYASAKAWIKKVPFWVWWGVIGFVLGLVVRSWIS